jgi:hypothetical protein
VLTLRGQNSPLGVLKLAFQNSPFIKQEEEKLFPWDELMLKKTDTSLQHYEFPPECEVSTLGMNFDP